MTRMGIAVGMTLGALAWLSGCASQQGHFGEAMHEPGPRPMTVAELVHDVERHEGKTVRVQGTITDMCDDSGCWMELAQTPESEDRMIVVFTYDRDEHGRVPPEARGHAALVEGRIFTITTADNRTGVRMECPAARIDHVKPVAAEPCDDPGEKEHDPS